MKIFARYLLATSLVFSAAVTFGQDTTKRKNPVQKPALAAPSASTAVPAKQFPAKPSLWIQLQSAKDSLSTERSKLTQAQAQLAEKDNTISGLQDSLKSKAQTPAETVQPENSANNVSILGSTFPFATYNAIVLGALLFFALAFAFVVFRSAGYRREAQYRINLFNELSDEFQAHKIKANDKEKKLARELQDERNKLEELKGR